MAGQADSDHVTVKKLGEIYGKLAKFEDIDIRLAVIARGTEYM